MKKSLMSLTAALIFLAPAAALAQPYRRWMNDNRLYLNDKTLRQIIFPGSHDAGTGVFHQPYTIADEKRCERTSVDAEADCIPVEQGNFVDFYNTVDSAARSGVPSLPSIGSLALSQFDIRSRIASIARTHRGTILSQLNAGSRYFDLRPYGEKGGVVYNTHTLYGQKMDDVFSEIIAFLDANPNEIIILHERQNGGYLRYNFNAYWQQVTARIGDRLIATNRVVPISVSPGFTSTTYVPRKFDDTYAQLIREDPKRRIIYMTNKGWVRPVDRFLWIRDFDDVGWPGEAVTGAALKTHVESLFRRQAGLTNRFVIASLTYSPSKPEYGALFAANQGLTAAHNRFIKDQIVGWLDQWGLGTRKGMNVLMTDFIQDNPAFVAKIIELNKAAYPSAPVVDPRALPASPTGGPVTISFKNNSVYSVRFVVNYRDTIRSRDLTCDTGLVRSGGNAACEFPYNEINIVSLRVSYKDITTERVNNLRVINRPVRQAPKSFTVEGKLLEKPRLIPVN